MKVSLNILWGLVAVYIIGTVLSFIFPDLSSSIAVLILIVFALIHGAMRYRWSGIIAFIILALVVSNILENVSILTGFPFGHYHYTDALGPKLFLVPLVIGPSYCAVGYLAWVLATVLIGEVRRGSSALTTFAVPFVGSFVMVVWDLCFDPTLSTVQRSWIWEQGGGYFGVPLTNYLGWFLTVYVFFQLFALYVRFRGSDDVEKLALPRYYYAQAIIMYAAIGLTFVVEYPIGGNTQVTDAAGIVWHTGSINESAAIISIFTMIFVSALATLKLLQGQPVNAMNQNPVPGPADRNRLQSDLAEG